MHALIESYLRYQFTRVFNMQCSTAYILNLKVFFHGKRTLSIIESIQTD